MLENCHMNNRELDLVEKISFKSFHNIMTNILDMKRVVAGLVLKELHFVWLCARLFGQKTQRMSTTKYRTRLIFLVCLSPVPEDKITTSKKVSWVDWGHKRKFAKGTKGPNLSTKNVRRIRSCAGIIILNSIGPSLKVTK